MTCRNKSINETEQAYLCALSDTVATFTEGMSIKELVAIGLGTSQIYQLRRKLPINFTALTLRRLEIGLFLKRGFLAITAENKAKESQNVQTT